MSALWALKIYFQVTSHKGLDKPNVKTFHGGFWMGDCVSEYCLDWTSGGMGSFYAVLWIALWLSLIYSPLVFPFPHLHSYLERQTRGLKGERVIISVLLHIPTVQGGLLWMTTEQQCPWKYFFFVRTEYSCRWSPLLVMTIDHLSRSYGCLDDGAKKIQMRERKLRPKPEEIKIKLEPVIFGSIHRLLIWDPWTIREYMEEWVLGS